MIDFNLDMEHRILTICPKGPLSEQDFNQYNDALSWVQTEGKDA